MKAKFRPRNGTRIRQTTVHTVQTVHTVYTQCTVYTAGFLRSPLSVAVACKYCLHCSVPARRPSSPGVIHSPHNTKVRLSLDLPKFFHVNVFYSKSVNCNISEGFWVKTPQHHKGASVSQCATIFSHLPP